MAILSAHGLVKSYGPATILDGVTVTLRAAERVGLVGINGGGKSTLARILAGVEVADQGEVTRRRGLRVRYLSQEPAFDGDLTARQVVAAGLEAWNAASQRHDAVSEQLAAGEGDQEALLAAQAEAAAEVERLGGWDQAHRSEAVLQKLGVKDVDQPVGTMSGGERRRVALAQVLVAQPDLAILDEPTNHLDADTIEWLEAHLVDEFPGALLLITHDRYVLDRVVERTLEVDAGKLHDYEGGWEAYLTAKAERQLQEARVEANRQNFLRRELEWLRRQPKARTTKSKSRVDRAEAALGESGPGRGRQVKLEIQSSDLGGTVLEAEGLTLAIEDRILVRDLDFKLTRGERVGILGANGTGKTTLLRALVGELTPTRGRVIVGTKTQLAYFDQRRAGLVDDLSIVENVAGERRTVAFAGRDVSVFSYLERFLFRGDKIRQPVGSLSGGERARVVLAKLLLTTANVLLLDEPTNDLDVATLSSLEETLEEFPGVVIVVTHDRYFLDRIATGTFVFEGDGKVTRYPGGYATYQRLKAQAAAQQKAVANDSGAARAADKKVRGEKKKGGKLTYAERLELEGLLDQVTVAEEKVAELEGQLADPSVYTARADDVPEMLLAVDRARAEAARLTARWEELEEKKAAAD